VWGCAVTEEAISPLAGKFRDSGMVRSAHVLPHFNGLTVYVIVGKWAERCRTSSDGAIDSRPVLRLPRRVKAWRRRQRSVTGASLAPMRCILDFIRPWAGVNGQSRRLAVSPRLHFLRPQGKEAVPVQADMPAGIAENAEVVAV
jgi:hypothetical protein